MHLYFVETRVFTGRIVSLGLEEYLPALQEYLLQNPAAGATDSGTGGLRKVRMGTGRSGKGKRGGARVHYLWLSRHQVVYFLYVYGKDEQDRLEEAQKKELRRVVELIKAEWDTAG